MEIRQMMIANARRLGLFVFIATAMVFSVFFSTRQQINANERQVMIDQLESVLAAVHYDNDLLGQVRQLQAVSAPDGYSGPIKLLIGVKPSGEILSVRVIAHQETPGLGDGIDIKKSSWITQFDHQSLTKTSFANWKVKKDGGAFDQLTGATITPRAVVKAIKTLLGYYRTNKSQLLKHQRGDSQHAAL